MNLNVHVLQSDELLALERQAHPDDPVALRFIAVQLSAAEAAAVMGYTSQHRCLALWHHFGYDLARLVAWYTAALALPKQPEFSFPRELHTYTYVAGGFIAPGIRRGQHVPAEDTIFNWESWSLGVRITPPSWRALLEPAVLPHVTTLIEPRLAEARRLLDHPSDDF